MEEEECRAEGVACPQLAFADNSEVRPRPAMRQGGASGARGLASMMFGLSPHSDLRVGDGASRNEAHGSHVAYQRGGMRLVLRTCSTAATPCCTASPAPDALLALGPFPCAFVGAPSLLCLLQGTPPRSRRGFHRLALRRRRRLSDSWIRRQESGCAACRAVAALVHLQDGPCQGLLWRRRECVCRRRCGRGTLREPHHELRAPRWWRRRSCSLGWRRGTARSSYWTAVPRLARPADGDAQAVLPTLCPLRQAELCPRAQQFRWSVRDEAAPAGALLKPSSPPRGAERCDELLVLNPLLPHGVVGPQPPAMTRLPYP
eukprot:scaffold198540_cov29-Tisochrysis_lutea.AAC.9